MAGRKQLKIRATNLKTGDVEEMALTDWAKKYNHPRDSVYASVRRGFVYKGYKLERAGLLEVISPVHVSEKDKKKIVEGYQSGESVEGLRSRFPYCCKTIRKVLYEAGFTGRLPYRPKMDKSVVYPDYEISDTGKLRALYRAGWSTNKIADEFNTSEKKVIDCLRGMALWTG